jgi:magnesium transporter
LIVLTRLPSSLRRLLIENSNLEDAADYLHEMPEVQALRLLAVIEPAIAADFLEELPKDEQADLVGELSEQKQASIVSEMKSDDADEVRDLIEYDDEEAGGIMLVHFVAIDTAETVSGVIQHLQRNAEEFSDFEVQYVYVVEAKNEEAGEPTNILKGVLRLRDLLLSPAETRISNLMIQNPLSVDVHAPLKDLHKFFNEHNYVGVPVIENTGKLVGVLRRGDVEEAMSEKRCRSDMPNTI